MSTPASGGQGLPAQAQQTATGQAGAAQNAPAAHQAAAPTGPAAAHQAGAPAAQAQSAPAGQRQSAPAPGGQAQGSSTPRLLRWARGAAAGAALLTGVVATGTFDAGGLNATPNVIAQQWVAAEEAGVEMAHADLLAAQRVSGGDADPELRASFDEAVGTVGQDLTRAAGSGDPAGAGAGSAAGPWSTFVLASERAAAGSSADTYATASEAARDAQASTDALAEQHAEDLRTGSRSTLTAVVGSLATLLLLGLMVWLALRTRRILNIPLLIATAITAGLTYISLNPSALPVDYDRRVGQASATATALQEVYQERAALHAVDLGLEDRWDAEATEAREAVRVLADGPLDSARTQLDDALGSPTDGSQADQALADSQQAFTSLEQGLRQRLEEQLGESAAAVGRPAAITSGAALLLGLVAAALAWAGISQRLKDYR